MYIYKILLSPANSKLDFDFTAYKNILIEAAKKINNGIAFKRDYKMLEIDNISQKEMVIILSSKRSLAKPAKSLSALTRYCTTNYPELFSKYIYNKMLFTMVLLSQQGTADIVNNDDITNEELLKKIIDFLYTLPDTKEKLTAVNNIKDIIKPFFTE